MKERTFILLVILTAGFCMLAALVILKSAHAQDMTSATTVQEGTISPTACDNTNLPANVWTLVRYDNAGEPCATRPSQMSGPCAPNTWNWIVEGHFTFTVAPGYKRVRVRVQVWAGGGGGACYGGTADPIFCDNPAFKLLKSDETYVSANPGNDLAVPFTSLEYLLAPYFDTPSDANYQGVWIFAYPINRPAVCRQVSFHDLGAN